MNWNEFRDMVDALVKEHGISGTAEVVSITMRDPEKEPGEILFKPGEGIAGSFRSGGLKESTPFPGHMG